MWNKKDMDEPFLNIASSLIKGHVVSSAVSEMLGVYVMGS